MGSLETEMRKVEPHFEKLSQHNIHDIRIKNYQIYYDLFYGFSIAFLLENVTGSINLGWSRNLKRTVR